jgi:hypothetical protein
MSRVAPSRTMSFAIRSAVTTGRRRSSVGFRPQSPAVHSAKVMDFERGSRRCCSGRKGNFLASATCGWTQATVERTRAGTWH